MSRLRMRKGGGYERPAVGERVSMRHLHECVDAQSTVVQVLVAVDKIIL